MADSCPLCGTPARSVIGADGGWYFEPVDKPEPLAVVKGRLYEECGPGACDLAIEEWLDLEPQDVMVTIHKAIK